MVEIDHQIIKVILVKIGQQSISKLYVATERSWTRGICGGKEEKTEQIYINVLKKENSLQELKT